jgi:cell pole-organizing protein PopZ
MSLSAKNYEPPIEEILASIRRSIAARRRPRAKRVELPPSLAESIADHPTPRANRVDHPSSLAHELTLDDEFELPAMFRAPRQSGSVQVGVARGAAAAEQRKSAQSQGLASTATGHVARPAEAHHEFDQDRIRLRPSTLTRAGEIALWDKAPDPTVGALQRAHWSLSILGSGLAEEDASARPGGGSFAPDRPALSTRAPSRVEAGDQVPSLPHANPVTEEPPSTDASAGATGSALDAPAPDTSEPDTSGPGLVAPQTASQPLPALGSGASEARARSQIEDGALARDDMSAAPKVHATASDTKSNTDSMSRRMISISATLVVCVDQTQVDTEVDAEAHKPLLPNRSAASRSYGPIIPVGLAVAEVPCPSPERHGALASSPDNVDTVEALSGGTRMQEDGKVAPAASGSLDETAIAVLRPLLRTWLECHMPPLLEDAIRAELSGGKSRK